jgi:osmotically inducible protein OsmC
MAIRTAAAEWAGDLKTGKGSMRLGSGAFAGNYSFASRFEDGQPGTNPEELIGAAHAGCFSMALAHELAQSGHPPRRIATAARVHLDKSGEGFRITAVELDTEGEVPGLDAETFQRFAEDAKRTCPVSTALAGTEIRLQAKLL